MNLHSKLLKGYLIDPSERTISEIAVSSQWPNITSHLGMDFQRSNSIPLNRQGDVIYLNEDCPFTEETPSFMLPILGTKIKDDYYKIHGQSLILGSSSDGAERSAVISKIDLESMLIWSSKMKPKLKMVFRHNELPH